MAVRNTTDTQRFVLRSPDKKVKTYFVPTSELKSRVVTNILRLPTSTLPNVSSSPTSVKLRTKKPEKSSINTNTVHIDKKPARRIIVIRNTKNSQVPQKSVNIGDFNQSDSKNIIT